MKTLLVWVALLAASVYGTPVENVAAAKNNEVGFFARVKTQFFKMCGGCGGGYGGGTGCFPGSVQVLTPGGEKAIGEVSAGDQVYVVDEDGQVKVDTVFLQAHKAAHLDMSYVHLRTSSGRSLALSPEHYVYIGVALRQAGEVQVGDSVSVVRAGGEMVSEQVVSVRREVERGVYNPWTLSGHLLAGGVHSSVYSADTRPFSPAALHTLFWPLRQLTAVTDMTFQGGKVTEGQPDWLYLAECMLHKMVK